MQETQPSHQHFFFIGGIFYVSDEDVWAKRILIWRQEGDEENGSGQAKRRKTNSGGEDKTNANGTPTILSMAKVILRDVGLKLGVRYLYCHDDFCEHILIVSDIRLMHPLLDRHSRRQEEEHHHVRPMFVPRSKRRACEVCLAWGAEYVTSEDRLVPESVCFLCRHCFHMLHYSVVEGHCVYEFTLHKYSRDA